MRVLCTLGGYLGILLLLSGGISGALAALIGERHRRRARATEARADAREARLISALAKLSGALERRLERAEGRLPPGA